MNPRRLITIGGLVAMALATPSLIADGAEKLPAEKYDTKTAAFAVKFKGESSAYRDTSIFVLPGETLTIDAVGGPPGDYALATDAGIAVQRAARSWKLTAPKRPGQYDFTVRGPSKKDAIDVHLFVMVPASQVRNGVLNGYRIGQYPPPLKGNPAYLAPRGFVEVTKETADTRVTPHFKLKQFICKQEVAEKYPKYVVLQERLLLKLEAILELVNTLGFKADTLNVMSAYRTPYYNHAIGDVKHSMHQFGSASDIFVDPGEKNRMEDLNRDGRIDTADAKFLYDHIERMLGDQRYQRFQGGMGFYPATSAHPPFVHVDVRGTKARWKG